MTKDLGKLWAERMTMSERDTSFPDSEPRDAATLILIDRSGPTPQVLLGRRHAGHKFMPGKFVFPGGRIEALDQQMTAVSELHPDAQKKLLERVENGEIDPSFVITHRAKLEEGPDLYKTFRDKKDGCIKVVLNP